ncbi:MAG TPA: DsbC family protein [Sulfurivirga caldicuralii]|nr:DsbC family protein [Sulfurivirga caldicuralii]
MKKLLPGLLLAATTQVWADAATLEKRLQANAGPAADIQVKDTPIKGLYEITADGQVFYISGDGRYAVRGELLDLQTRTNLTEPARQQARISLLKQLKPEQMITYPAKGKPVREIWVFDDLDCPYCRKLHKLFPKLQENGVTIHVLFYPRSGLGSTSYFNAIKVWCSGDQRQALDQAMVSGQVAEGKICRHPINEHLALAQKIGVTGTPYMVLDTGEVIPGYVPPGELIPYLTKTK